MIYVLEDDESIRELVCYTLNASGMETQGYELPSEFFAAVKKEVPSLVLLDIMLPEMDGLSVLKRLRAEPETTAVLVMMLTAKGTEYDKVVGLDLGADDYVAKPFGMMELISRVRALLRRCLPSEPETLEYNCDGLYVSRDKHLVTVDGEDVILTLKEFELLCLLIENKGIVLSRDTLLSRVWGYSFDGESRTIDVHIRTLRQKLGSATDMIETVRGVGYRFCGKSS